MFPKKIIINGENKASVFINDYLSENKSNLVIEYNSNIKKNIQDTYFNAIEVSDGSLFIVKRWELPKHHKIFKSQKNYCLTYGKSYKIIFIDKEFHNETLLEWVKKNKINILNIVVYNEYIQEDEFNFLKDILNKIIDPLNFLNSNLVKNPFNIFQNNITSLQNNYKKKDNEYISIRPNELKRLFIKSRHYKKLLSKKVKIFYEGKFYENINITYLDGFFKFGINFILNPILDKNEKANPNYFLFNLNYYLKIEKIVINEIKRKSKERKERGKTLLNLTFYKLEKKLIKKIDNFILRKKEKIFFGKTIINSFFKKRKNKVKNLTNRLFFLNEYKSKIDELDEKLFRLLIIILKKSNPEYTTYSTFNYDHYLLNFNENDLNLINLWMVKSRNDYELNRMKSARIAEKFIIDLFKSSKNKVEDISIKQISNHDNSWKYFDLIINDKFKIDVKNGRPTINNKTGYIENIAKFKKFENDDVIIAGVRSPYVFNDNYYDKNIEIKFLGITDLNLIDKFTHLYGNQIIDINLNINELNFIPPWLYVYPNLLLKKTKNINYNLNFLSKSQLNLINDDLNIFHYLANKICFHKKYKYLIKKDINLNLFNKILSIEQLNLPHIYLTLVTNFIIYFKKKPNFDFDLEELLNILYSKDHLVNNNFQYPMLVYDPLETIYKLVNLFDDLYKYKEKIDFKNYEMFKFKAEGILRGKKYNESHWQTIFAYCGGRIKEKGKCGYFPLIYGIHKHCKVCGYLICNEDICDYCSSNCTRFINANKNIISKIDQRK